MMQAPMSEISQFGSRAPLWDFPHMGAPKRKLIDNAALLNHLMLVKPADMSVAQWLEAADVNSSYFTDLRNGREPGIYKIERLAAVAAMRLSEFWRGVELTRFEIERRKADELAEAAENAVSIGSAQRKAIKRESPKERADQTG